MPRQGDMTTVAQPAQRALESVEVAILAVTLSAIQIIDGVFTSIGITMFGLEMEANPFLRSLMQSIGVSETLTVVKCVAILTIFILFKLSAKVTWIPTAFKGLILLYLFAAILPWTIILSKEVVL
jgi:uncharacterized membrane protein